jgi:hypothetical protein
MNHATECNILNTVLAEYPGISWRYVILQERAKKRHVETFGDLEVSFLYIWSFKFNSSFLVVVLLRVSSHSPLARENMPVTVGSPAQESTIIVLDKLLQDDPNLPSLAYQAHENVPIRIPWSKKYISLGSGFDSTCAGTDQNPFRPSPFDDLPSSSPFCPSPQLNISLESNGTFRTTSSSEAATSHEHMGFKGALSVGGSFVGASCQGTFAKEVYANRDVSTVTR